jgi:hypothetical protein
MPTLDTNDVVVIRDEVRRELDELYERAMSRGGQEFGYGFLAELVSRIVLPILVSLCGRGLYDVLQGKLLGSLSKKQADKLCDEMVGKEISSSSEIDEICMTELKRELLPMGLSEQKIQELYEGIRRRLHSNNKEA